MLVTLWGLRVNHSIHTQITSNCQVEQWIKVHNVLTTILLACERHEGWMITPTYSLIYKEEW